MRRRRALLHTARLWTFPVAELFQAGPRASLCRDTDTVVHVHVYVRARKVEREGGREIARVREDGIRDEREASLCARRVPVGIYHSRVVLPRAGGVMQQCYLPPRLMRRRRGREGERQRSRRRGRGRRGGECLCLAVMAYSQGRSGRTKPRTLSRHLACVERILSSSLSNRKDRASVGP